MYRPSRHIRHVAIATIGFVVILIVAAMSAFGHPHPPADGGVVGPVAPPAITSTSN